MHIENFLWPFLALAVIYMVGLVSDEIRRVRTRRSTRGVL